MKRVCSVDVGWCTSDKFRPVDLRRRAGPELGHPCSATLQAEMGRRQPRVASRCRLRRTTSLAIVRKQFTSHQHPLVANSACTLSGCYWRRSGHAALVYRGAFSASGRASQALSANTTITCQPLTRSSSYSTFWRAPRHLRYARLPSAAARRGGSGRTMNDIAARRSMWQHWLDDAPLEIRRVVAHDQAPVEDLNHSPLICARVRISLISAAHHPGSR